MDAHPDSLSLLRVKESSVGQGGLGLSQNLLSTSQLSTVLSTTRDSDIARSSITTFSSLRVMGWDVQGG